METSFGWGGSESEVAHIAVELADQGVVTQVHSEPPVEGWPEPPPRRGGSEEPEMGGSAVSTASLSYRNRDAKAVAATLRAHGLPFPDIP